MLNFLQSGSVIGVCGLLISLVIAPQTVSAHKAVIVVCEAAGPISGRSYLEDTYNFLRYDLRITDSSHPDFRNQGEIGLEEEDITIIAQGDTLQYLPEDRHGNVIGGDGSPNPRVYCRKGAAREAFEKIEMESWETLFIAWHGEGHSDGKGRLVWFSDELIYKDTITGWIGRIQGSEPRRTYMLLTACHGGWMVEWLSEMSSMSKFLGISGIDKDHEISVSASEDTLEAFIKTHTGKLNNNFGIYSTAEEDFQEIDDYVPLPPNNYPVLEYGESARPDKYGLCHRTRLMWDTDTSAHFIGDCQVELHGRLYDDLFPWNTSWTVKAELEVVLKPGFRYDAEAEEGVFRAVGD